MLKKELRPWPWVVHDSDAVRLLLVGDTNLQNRKEPSSAFAHVLPTLQGGDVVFGHLEGPFRMPSSNLNEPDIPHKPGWKHSEPRMVEGLLAAGFDAMSCASNVTYGKGVIESTLSTLETAGIAHCGIGRNVSEARKPAIIEAKGVRFGFLSYTSVFWPYQHAAGPDSPGVATVKATTAYQPDRRALEMPGAAPIIVTIPDAAELVAMENDIRTLRGRVDIIVLSCHWGVSGSSEPADYQRIMAHKAVEAGADIIMGHHPHVLQPIEVYQGKPIFYSVGNFAFDWEKMRHRHKDGLLLSCLIRQGTLERVSFVPVRRNEDNLITILHPAEAGREIVEQVKELSSKSGTEFELVSAEVIVRGVGGVAHQTPVGVREAGGWQ
jgi:poly-gamma-glutamate synthesis protein (capsule biosynthesis protein)